MSQLLQIQMIDSNVTRGPETNFQDNIKLKLINSDI